MLGSRNELLHHPVLSRVLLDGDRRDGGPHPWVGRRRTNSEAIAVNNNGQVMGAFVPRFGSFTPRAVLWTPAGERVDLGTLSGVWSYPHALNNSGQVVGRSAVGPPGGGGPFDLYVHAFSWTAAGGMVDLGTLGGNFSYAEDVNDSGHVVGASTTASGEYHAFLWTPAGGMVDLGTMGDLVRCRCHQ